MVKQLRANNRRVDFGYLLALASGKYGLCKKTSFVRCVHCTWRWV